MPHTIGKVFTVALIFCGTLSESSALSPQNAPPEFALNSPPSKPTPEKNEQISWLLKQSNKSLRTLSVANTGGFEVTPTNREESRAFFNSVFNDSENTDIAFTGNIAACQEGTTSLDFKEATVLRVNYFRAMAGVPAAVIFSDAFSVQSQEAALMMSAENALNHNPSTSWACYTTTGANAAGNSNLSLGNYGWNAVFGQMRDNGSTNTEVGHRRWILYPQTEVMGTGDVGVQGDFREANSLWVFDGNFSSPRPQVRDDFVAWPPPGFVPYSVVFARWSFSYPGADFSTATVTMTQGSSIISLTTEALSSGFGENTIVWYPNSLNPSNSLEAWPKPDQDTIYTVSINNVFLQGNPSARNFQYSVTVFDPATPGSDTVDTTPIGSDSLAQGVNGAYTFAAIPFADSYQRRTGTLSDFTTTEGAENGSSNIIDGTVSDYSLFDNAVKQSGNFSFHLAQPDAEDQFFQLTQILIPQAGASIEFGSRLGFATVGQVARVQVSVDGGTAWATVYEQAGNGGSTDSDFVNQSVSLASYVDRSILIRFAYEYEGGLFFSGTTSGVGWYVDQISFTNVKQMLNTETTSFGPTNSFNFNSSTLGDIALQVRAIAWGGFPQEWGKVKSVSITAFSITDSFSTAAVIQGANSWYSTDWLGRFYTANWPWLYHLEHTWLYVDNSADEGIWLYDPALGWLWTSSEIYPALYRSTGTHWLYYSEESEAPRYFYDYRNSNWVPEDNL